MALIATCIEQGDREEQQDAVFAHINSDGSWVIAVADGPGCGAYPEVAARLAVAAIPTRIESEQEMGEAFAVANWQLRRLQPDLEGKTLADDLKPYAHVTDTTLTVAAWSPEGGLLAAWVGDSVPAVFTPNGEQCWVGMPADASGCFFVGDCAVLDNHQEPSPTLLKSMRRLSDTVTPADLAEAASDGLTVVVMSDGAYNGWMLNEDGLPHQDDYGFEEYLLAGEVRDVRPCRDTSTSWLWHMRGPNCLEHAYMHPAKRTLSDAQRTADYIVNRAKRCGGLHDNTSVAVGIVPPAVS